MRGFGILRNGSVLRLEDGSFMCSVACVKDLNDFRKYI